MKRLLCIAVRNAGKQQPQRRFGNGLLFRQISHSNVLLMKANNLNNNEQGNNNSDRRANYGSSGGSSLLPAQVSFEDFLKADANRDGRVTATEWDNYIRSKQKVEADPNFRGLTIHIPISPQVLREVIENDGFGVTINGLHYSVNLKPEGETFQLIKYAEERLESIDNAIRELEDKKAPLEAAAARHTRRVMSGLLAYLLIQAGVVAKLTFFSRFGWDIMEPITYFITFGISLVGLTFFTWNRLEFSYPALAALVARRKAEKLYRKHNFDEEALLSLARQREQVQRQLDAMMPAHRIFSPYQLQSSKQQKSSDKRIS